VSTDSTLAARVPAELRDAVEAKRDELRGAGVHYPDGREVDLSFVLRVALSRYVGVHDGGLLEVDVDAASPDQLRQAAALLEDGQPGTARKHDRPTAKRAASTVAGRAGTQRRRALELFEVVGARGLTTDEVCAELDDCPVNGVARRVTDLLQGGLIEEVYAAGGRVAGEGRAMHGDPVMRKTRHGSFAQVWRITGEGLLALTAKRKQEALPKPARGKRHPRSTSTHRALGAES
jgi:hypothetical protein